MNADKKKKGFFQERFNFLPLLHRCSSALQSGNIVSFRKIL